MKTKRQLLSLLMVLSVLISGLLPNITAYASGISTPGSIGKSNATLTSGELIMSVTVPSSVLIHVDAEGTVTTPDRIPIVNNSVAPVFVHSLAVTTNNGWALDPITTNYTNHKVNLKNYWLSFNGLDPSTQPIALATQINGGGGEFNLLLSADVSPQKTAINVLNIGEIVITMDWDKADDAQEPELPPEAGFTVSDVYYVGDDIGIKLIPTVTGDLDAKVVSKISGETVKTSTWRVDTLVGDTFYIPLDASFDKSIAYDVIVTLTGDDGKTYGPVMTVLSAEENNSETAPYTAPYTVNSVVHDNLIMDEIIINITVNKPSQGFVTVVPTGTDPTTGPSQNYSLNMFDLGTMRESIKIYSANYDSYVDNDVYITKDFDDFTDAIKVYLPARGTNTGGTGSGEHIPDGYELATDDDFSGDTDGAFMYIGSKIKVVIPHVIKGVPVTKYTEMFKYSNAQVTGVFSDNPNITDVSYMFETHSVSELVLSLDTRNVVNYQGMFKDVSITDLDISPFDTSKATNMQEMFMQASIGNLDLSHFNTSNLTTVDLMFVYANIQTVDLSSFVFSGGEMSWWNVFDYASIDNVYVGSQADKDYLSGRVSGIDVVIK